SGVLVEGTASQAAGEEVRPHRVARASAEFDESGRWVLTAKQAPRRPGTAPALGLRAERAVVILSQTTTAKETTIWVRSGFRGLKTRPSVAPVRRSPRRPTTARPQVEPLEDRSLPSCTVILAPSDDSPLVGERVTWTATAADCGAAPVYQFSAAAH